MKANKFRTKNYVTLLIAFLILALTFVLQSVGALSRHWQSMLVPICINAVLAISLNFVVGFLGELSLGHAGFMSVGAYAGCLFSIYTQEILPTMIRYPLAMVTGGAVAALFGLLVGIPVLRLKGDYLAIVTLAFGEIVRSIIINLGFTGGASGLKGTPQDAGFLSSAVVVMITLVLFLNIANSKQGRAIMSLRDNTIAAESCGVNISNYKLMAFVIAAFFAGVAGTIYGHNYNILQSGTFDYNKSIEILVIVVLGGMGSIRGSFIAAIVMTVLPEELRFMNDYRMLLYSLVLIFVMLINASSKFKLMMTNFKSKLIKKKQEEQ